jgi:hypothetical protein
MIEDTSQRDPMLHLLGALTEGTSGYIEGMEATGQQQFETSDTLPTDSPWDGLIELGFRRGLPVPGDDLFTRCALPDGWAKRPTGHSMWTDIVDERGVRRVAVSYKAAFYDRRTFCRITRAGADLANEILYGDGPVALPAEWDKLTAAERDEFWQAVEEMRKGLGEFPDMYGKYQPRVDALLALRGQCGAAE